MRHITVDTIFPCSAQFCLEAELRPNCSDLLFLYRVCLFDWSLEMSLCDATECKWLLCLL